MKKLYLIGGTMGVGKTTACRILRTKLSRTVFLDGDWCWYSHPFVVTEETKRMVEAFCDCEYLKRLYLTMRRLTRYISAIKLSRAARN